METLSVSGIGKHMAVPAQGRAPFRTGGFPSAGAFEGVHKGRVFWFLAVVLSATLGLQDAFAEEFPGRKADREFDQYVEDLDLEQTDRFNFSFKTGGTSVGFKIAEKGERKAGLFLPKSSATDLEAEVVVYRLSRLLGVSRLVNPVAYYDLGPQAIARFRRMLRSEKNIWRAKNTNRVRYSILRNPKKLSGIYKFRHKRESQSVDQLTYGNGFNQTHSLARFIKASGPRPEEKFTYLGRIWADQPGRPRPKESQRELARQLSTIFLLDMLMGQWDRFSGGNIEAYALNSGRVRFVARDNGGASPYDGWSWFGKYRRWVSRFDRDVVERLVALNAFLTFERERFLGFGDVAALRNALGFRRDKSFSTFAKKLKILVEKHLPKLEQEYGEKVYFLPPGTGPEIMLALTEDGTSPKRRRRKPRVAAKPKPAKTTRTAALSKKSRPSFRKIGRTGLPSWIENSQR